VNPKHKTVVCRHRQKHAQVTTTHETRGTRSTDVRQKQLLDQFLGLEVSTQIEHLPRGEADQAAHGEDGEVEDARMCRLYVTAHTQTHSHHITPQLRQSSNFTVTTPSLLRILGLLQDHKLFFQDVAVTQLRLNLETDSN